MNSVPSPRPAALLLGLVLVATGGPAARVCAQAPTFAGPRIAVADITRIFNAYHKRLEYQEKLEATGKSLREREELFKTRIRNLEKEISGLAMGHPRREQLLKDLRRQRTEYARFSLEARRQLDDAVRESTAVLYEDIARAVEAYAKAHRIDLVIKQQSFPRRQPSAEKQAHSIGRRTVLYCDPDLDITDRIIEVLNRKPGEKPGPATE